MKKFILGSLLVCSVVMSVNAQWFESKLPVQLTDVQGKLTSSADVLKGKIVGVYFSASWCPPCRAFTPRLVEFYNEVKKSGDFELILVSCDRTAQAMTEYMKKYNMPFFAAPFRDPVANALMRDLNVRGIPTLAIFSPEGKLITINGRNDVMKEGAKALDEWKKNL